MKCLSLAWVGILCLVMVCPEVTAAEKFPEKPIKILVGFTAGGTADLQTRMLGSLMSEDLGQPVIVINKPGAAATIAVTEVATSKPDGYTPGSFPILVVSLTSFFVKVKYDPLSSLDPLIGCWAHPYGICVLQNAPWKFLRELIEFARKNPGDLSVSTPLAPAPRSTSPLNGSQRPKRYNGSTFPIKAVFPQPPPCWKAMSRRTLAQAPIFLFWKAVSSGCWLPIPL